MLFYICKNCGIVTLVPMINKFNEAFCCENCYKKYCKRNDYEAHPEELKSIFTD